MSSRSLRVYPQATPLRGTVTVPGDKSISHRAVMLAAIAEGTSHIRAWLPAGDTRATLEAMRQLGVHIEIVRHSETSWDLTIEGLGLRGLQASTEPVDCANAGTAMRLLAGLLSGQPISTILSGSEQLRKRPMGRIVNPLKMMGADIEATDGKVPLTIHPAPLHAIDYHLPVASAQVKSAVLLAGLFADGQTRVHEPGPARDHSERMLAAMGVMLKIEGGTITITPPDRLQPLDLDVPADISSAAFPLVAAAIVPHSEVTLAATGVNETRTGLVDLLEKMGTSISLHGRRMTGGEPVADVSCHFSELHAADAVGDVVVRAIDEFPVLAVAATQAAGESRVHDAAELRVKEVDRIAAVVAELHKLGAQMQEHDDGFSVVGPLRLQGGTVDSRGDHRLGMALAVAALVATAPVTILDADCIADSFPGFVEIMRSLGARMEWVD